MVACQLCQPTLLRIVLTTTKGLDMCAAFNDVRAAAPRGANQGPPVLDPSQGMLDPPLADLSFGRAMFIILTTF